MFSNPKTVDKQFNEYLFKLIYATFKDIEADWNGDITFSPFIYQSYDNLCKAADDQLVKPKNRFMVSDPTRQFLTFLFAKLLEELSITEFDADDDIDTIRSTVVDANFESYTDFMFGVADAYKCRFGTTLGDAEDSGKWFHNRIMGALPNYLNTPQVYLLISSEFELFLKAIAWNIGKLQWYNPATITEKYFLALLSQLGINQDMLDILHSCLRDKPVPKPRARKAVVKPVTADDNIAEEEVIKPEEEDPKPEKEEARDAPLETADSVEDVLRNLLG